MNNEPEGPRRRRAGLLPPLAAVWFIGFTLYFFSQGLPNANARRVDLWQESPWLILDSILPPLPEPGQVAPTSSGFRFLGQRFDQAAWAALVLIGAWHLGSLGLRAVLRGRSDSPPPSTGLHFALSGLVGLSAWSLIVLGCGLSGLLCRWIFGAALVAFVAAEQWIEHRRPWRQKILTTANGLSLLGDRPRLVVLCVFVMAPFVLAMALGSLLPSTDFDVKAYHLVGPKEWFQAGRITFLDNNVYTSFPFLTEMLLLSTMVLSGDWWTGGLAGQLVLASFGAYAAIVVFQIASRFSRAAGWLAALSYVTTPWAVRISIIAYVEGALAAYLAATLAAFLWSRQGEAGRASWTAICGFLAGSAASCKYPGVISALIPFGLAVVVEGLQSSPGRRLRSALTQGAVFSAAGLMAFGPWLLKNLVQTGNPVYPLLWGLFGGKAFDAGLNAKFKAGHALPVDVLKDPFAWIPDLWRHLRDVAVGSDWQSPLMFGLAPAALFVWWSMRRTGERRLASDLAILLLDAAWLFLTWWALTHRIDRFWVPMLPIIAVLSGLGLRWIISGVRVPLLTATLVAIAAATWYHLAFIASPLIGFNGYLMDEGAARRVAETPGMTIINSLPDDSRTLLIGEAQVFEARRPVTYSTVFNHNVFEQLFAAEDGKSMKPAAELKQALKDHGITHILVNWNEVLRYRTTYGYTDFVTPEHVHHLEKLGLMTPVPLPRGVSLAVKVDDQSDSRKFQLATWGQSLIQADPEGNWYPAYELWRVVD